jgi:hypothetical protein
MSNQRLLHGDLLIESLERVLALKFLKLSGRVLVQELVDGEEASAHAHVDLVLVDAHVNALGAKLVDALGLTHEHDLEFLAVGVVVDVLSEALVNLIVLHGDVNRDARLEVNDVLLQGLNFKFRVFQRVEELK